MYRPITFEQLFEFSNSWLVLDRIE